MRGASVKRIGQAAIIALGAYLVAGGLLQSESDGVASETIEQAVESNAIAVETCAVVEDWQRPNDRDQAKQLEKDARYSAMTESDALKSASSLFWDSQVVSFTTYGLSARVEPVNLTGLWTVEGEMQDCYTSETTMAINEGDRAEAWLLNHRIESLERVGDRYVMTVEPTAVGMQVVQFNRADEQAALPLDVVNTGGESVEVASGDWQ